MINKDIHVYITSGDAGSQILSKPELAKIREIEATQSAKSLGVKDVYFLKYPDGLVSFYAPYYSYLRESSY